MGILGQPFGGRLKRPDALEAEKCLENVVIRACVAGGENVVEHRLALEKANVLEGARHAFGHDVVGLVLQRLFALRLLALGVIGHKTAADAVAAEEDLTLRERVNAGDEVEDGGLARAVGTDETVDLALLDLKGDVAHGGQTAEALGHMVKLQNDFVTNSFTHCAAASFPPPSAGGSFRFFPLSLPKTHLMK